MFKRIKNGWDAFYARNVLKVPVLGRIVSVQKKVTRMSHEMGELRREMFHLKNSLSSLLSNTLHETRELQNRVQWDYAQMESLFSIYSVLNLKDSLPEMRHSAISPDFARTMVSIILKHKPRLVVELGSGVSTLIAAYALQKIGQGEILSVEHDPVYFETVQRYLSERHLDQIAKVVLSPLEPVKIKGKEWVWYRAGDFAALSAIDFVIIDGPPQYGQPAPMVRYPALPVLYPKLSPHASLILDDAMRDDEKKTLEVWQREFKDFSYRLIETEKGTGVLWR
ncbi:MAG: class I SAM-dependent methyltransferase [Candidatus Omnitrophica bacterium]|nr:class I SAM-dependent methyltransferase [Candidatus Omnitrophota bacterium]MDD5671189.1 class I SAM-dependent methyltransferase [Candidatus Omnitrophota bacterium]